MTNTTDAGERPARTDERTNIEEEIMKEYETPELIEYGTVHELTQSAPYSGNDGLYGSVPG